MSGKTDAKETVYKYLEVQNRPYSANDVMQNLHNEFGKSAVQKALDDLTSENRICEKVYGKQKVYSVIQAADETDREGELLELDSQIEELAERVRKTESELKTTENELKELKTQPSREECLKERDQLREDITKLTERVKGMTNSECTISEADKKKLKRDSESYTKEYRKRKRICMDILNTILENCPKPKKALLEEIGIETDEDVGFKLQ